MIPFPTDFTEEQRLLSLAVCELPIMTKCCKTCPFKLSGYKMQDTELANKVIQRNLFKSQQICHSTEGKNRKPNNRCRGYYDYAYTIYERLNLTHLLK